MVNSQISTAEHRRLAHIHMAVSADGYVPVTTHLFDKVSKYLQSDAVFGV
jgi:protocatechuate 3,4-dioxygenase beta subunit